MYIQSRGRAQLAHPCSPLRCLAFLLAWALLLAAIGLIAAYLSPSPAGSRHIEEPGPLPRTAPAPIPAGPAALNPGSTVVLVSNVRIKHGPG
jgi:hypothetical protein